MRRTHVTPDAPGRLRALIKSVFTRETELSLPLEFETVVQAASRPAADRFRPVGRVAGGWRRSDPPGMTEFNAA